MCVNPRLLSNGVSVACRECWQCKANYVNDWVGRCIAEGEDCAACHSVTLTYGADADGRMDHPRAAVLTYSDVTKYLKRLRKDGYPVRFFCAGEYGSAKGRAHWHNLLFWKDRVPPHDLGVRFQEEHWHHGFSHWDKITAHSVRYVCKYIQKDLRDGERQRQIGMSKYPPLGARYFLRLARRHVDQGLSPRKPTYAFSDVVDKEGKTIQFFLRGASLDLFLGEFCRYWAEKRGGHPPASDLLTEYWDRTAQSPHSLTGDHYRPMAGKPWIEPPSPMYFSERHNAFACDHDGVTLFWSYDQNGERSWQSVIRTEAMADLMRAASERRKALGGYYSQSRGE